MKVFFKYRWPWPSFVALLLSAVCAVIIYLIKNTGSQIVFSILAIAFYMYSYLPVHLTERLNDYFVVVKYPFYKYRLIYEKSKNTKKHKNCSDYRRDLVDGMENMFTVAGHAEGIYRTVSHETVLGRIQNMEEAQLIGNVKQTPVYQKNLNKMNRGIPCRRCKNHCHLKHFFEHQKQFYLIEFEYVLRKGRKVENESG